MVKQNDTCNRPTRKIKNDSWTYFRRKLSATRREIGLNQRSIEPITKVVV